MKKRVRRLTAVCTAICLVGACLSPDIRFFAGDSWAAEAEDDSAQSSDDSALPAETEEQSAEAEDDSTQDSDDSALSAEAEEQQSAEMADAVEGLSAEDSDELIEKNSSTINYLIVESPYLETPDTERIIVCYGDGTEQVESASLYVTDEDGGTTIWDVSDNPDGFLVFEQDFADESADGVYEAVTLSVTDAEGEHIFAFSDYDMTVQFGVNEEYSGLDELEDLGEESGTSSDEDALSATVVEIDQNSDTAVEDIVEALENAEDEIGTDVSSSGEETTTAAVSGGLSLLSALLGTVTADASESDNIVVALDPGHDSIHGGATANGLVEDELTLKIAEYCKEELETYQGVTVYMTRTTSDCPYPSSTSSANDIKQRVAAAVEAGASIYVSIHLNSSTSSSAKGAEVIIPNTNYNSEAAEAGEALAQAILDELEAVGVTLRSTSIYSRTSTDGDTYPDGSLTDYYAVQKYSKLQGIPGIIVEHAFLTNSSDVSNFLSTESGLKTLGVADATGIAAYLGLSKSAWSAPALKSASATASGTKITWTAVSGATGYAVFRKTSGGSFSMIGTTTSTSYTDTASLTNGKTYYYTVRAYKGTQTTALANTYSSSYWTSYNSTGLKCVYTKTPTLSSSVVNTASGIKISWGSVSGVTGYAVYRKASGSDWSMIATTTSTSYTDTGASAGKTYYYTVRAYRGTLSTAKTNKYSASYWSGYDATGVSGIFTKTPTLSSATAAATGTKVTWKSVSGASGYAVYRKASGGSWSMIATTKSTGYTDTATLTAGKTYYYTVRAYRGSLANATSNKYSSTYWSYYNTTGVKSVYLATPTLSSATYSSSGIKVTWKSVSEASGYAVYRKTSGGNWSMIATTTSTSYTDKSSLTKGATYYYTVRAYKGTVSTAKSNRYNAAYWSGFDSSGVSVIVGSTLSTPALSSATAAATGTKVSWSAVSGASGYAVYRKVSGGSWSMIATTTSTSYTDTAVLNDGKTYYYTVRAYRGSLSTAKSNKYSSTYWSSYDKTGVGSVYLAVPTLSGEQAASGGVKVSWKPVTGATGYAIYRKVSGGSWSMVDMTTATSYTDTAVSTGKTYYYTVRAYVSSAAAAKTNRYSAMYWSGYDTTGSKAYYLSTPTLSGTSVVNNGIQVSWGTVSNATGYAVYRKISGGSWSMIGTTTGTSYTDTKGGSAGKVYYYTVRAYRGSLSTAKSKKYSSVYWSYYKASGVSGSAYSIEGSSTVTVAQMVAFYEKYSSVSYPSESLSKGGASTIKELATIYYEEAAAEGIRAEVAWCQAMYETGYLKFGGSVDISQYNFAGLGATDGSTSGASFTTVREGVRAHIQHLKAYASSTITSNTLAYDLVDPRFKYVTKGSAKYVEILGTQENPLGYGWATSSGYGTRIRSLITKLKAL